MKSQPSRKGKRVSGTLQFWLVVPALFACASPAFAHKLKIDCRVNEQRLHLEAFYDDNTPAQQARVTIKNEMNEVVASGKTDERGVWTCSAPPPGKYTARAETEGHVAEETLTVDAAQDSSNQPIREEETAVPWLRIVLGCAAIAILFATLWLARRRSIGAS